MAYEDYLILVESLAEVIDERIEIFLLLLDGCKARVAFFELAVVSSAASGLVPMNYCVVIDKVIERAVIHVSRG